MKKLFVNLSLALAVIAYAGPSFASGCFLCKGGSYVKFSTDNAESRKKAKECGCEVGGTRGECEASNLKILCTVQNETKSDFKWALKNK